MPKYTYKDVIIDPTSEEAKNCVGKKCYHADNPTACLDFANSNDENMIRILQCIQSENNNFPFCFGTREEYNHSCIILKKEEPKPNYVPFSNKEEFLSAYEEHTNSMKKYGIWIFHKMSENDDIIPRLITEMWSNGLIIGCAAVKTLWKYILEDFIFEDGTPCGKLQEENNV